MLSMVHLNMASKAPMEEIVALCDEIIAKVTDEAKEEDAIWKANKQDCDTTIP